MLLSPRSPHSVNRVSASFGCHRARVLKNLNPKTQTKVAVYNAVCFSTLLYVSKTWTPYRRHINILEAFDIRCLQCIFGITWEDRLSHNEILSTCIEASTAKRHLCWLGHVIRMPEHSTPSSLRPTECSQTLCGRSNKSTLKGHRMDPLKRCNIDPSSLETLVLDRSTWQSTCAREVQHLEGAIL